MKKVIKTIKVEASLRSLNELGDELGDNDPHSTNVNLEIQSDYGEQVDVKLVEDYLHALQAVANGTYEREQPDVVPTHNYVEVPDIPTQPSKDYISQKRLLTEEYPVYGGVTGGESDY